VDRQSRNASDQERNLLYCSRHCKRIQRLKFKVTDESVRSMPVGSGDMAPCPPGYIMHYTGDKLPEGWGWFSHVDGEYFHTCTQKQQKDVQTMKDGLGASVVVRLIVKLPDEGNLVYFKRKYGSRRSKQS
jgi:hypothetical protein